MHNFRQTLILFAFLAFIANSYERKRERQGKLFSLFSIVQFKNAACNTAAGLTASGSIRMGQCLTASECLGKGGAGSGDCASGFGVCCIFLATTGTVSQNCTYIRNEGFPGGFSGTSRAAFTVQKCSNDVCSLRLDFETFSLDGPADSVETNGGECATESVTITTSSGEPYPTICGENSGQHVYVEIGARSGNTADLSFTLANTNSIFEIKVTQIPCGAHWAPPKDCFQYHTGTVGRIMTFNYGDTTTSHLASQDYNICLRREEGFCCVEYTVCGGQTNQMSLNNEIADGAQAISAADRECSLDYIVITGASSVCSSQSNKPLTSKLCGRLLTATDRNVIDNVPLCDCCEPFNIQVVTNNQPEDMSDTQSNRGVCLDYRQLACCS